MNRSFSHQRCGFMYNVLSPCFTFYIHRNSGYKQKLRIHCIIFAESLKNNSTKLLTSNTSKLNRNQRTHIIIGVGVRVVIRWKTLYVWVIHQRSHIFLIVSRLSFTAYPNVIPSFLLKNTCDFFNI